MNLSELETAVRRKVMVYGPPKAGKTVAVGKLAEHGFKLHWMDLEKGISALVGNIDKKAFPNVEVYQIPDTKINPVAAETVLKIFMGGAQVICQKHGKASCPICKTGTKLDTGSFGDKDILVIDSVTQLSSSTLNHITKAQPDNYKCTFEDWRMQGALLEKILGIMQHANFHVICISHESLVEMEDKKMKIVPVMGTQNFSKQCARFFDDVVYVEVVNKQHKMSCSSTYANNVLSGSRTNKDVSINGLVELFK